MRVDSDSISFNWHLFKNLPIQLFQWRSLPYAYWYSHNNSAYWIQSTNFPFINKFCLVSLIPFCFWNGGARRKAGSGSKVLWSKFQEHSHTRTHTNWWFLNLNYKFGINRILLRRQLTLATGQRNTATRIFFLLHKNFWSLLPIGKIKKKKM